MACVSGIIVNRKLLLVLVIRIWIIICGVDVGGASVYAHAWLLLMLLRRLQLLLLLIEQVDKVDYCICQRVNLLIANAWRRLHL